MNRNRILSGGRGDQLQLNISIFRDTVRVEALYTFYGAIIGSGGRILIQMIKPLHEVALLSLMTVARGAATRDCLNVGLSLRWL